MKDLMRYTLASSLILSFLPSGASAAETVGANTQSKTTIDDGVVEQLSIVGTRLAKPPLSSHSVISREQIDNLNPASTTDLLQLLPNVSLSQTSAGTGQSYISIRGGESNFTLIMIDNVVVNDSTNSRGGGFDFNRLSVAAIERVEVYRGGVAAIYGSEAISGVIHFITKQPSASQAILQAKLGSDDYRQMDVTLTGNLTEKVTALVNVSSSEVEYYTWSKAKDKQALITLNSLGERLNHRFSLLVGDREAASLAEDSGGELYAQKRTPELRSSDFVMAGLSSELLGDSESLYESLHFALSWQRQQETSNHPGISNGVYSGVPASLIESTYRRAEAQVYAHWLANADWQVVTGVSHRDAVGENQGNLDFGMLVPVNFRLEQQVSSVFIETQKQWRKLSLSVGLRYENPSEFSADLANQVGLSWQFLPAHQVSFNYSEGYKLPSFFSLAHPLIGNSELKPESSENYELGWHYTNDESLTMDLVIFDNRYTNLVDFDPVMFKAVNRGAVDATGGEWRVNHAVNSWLDIAFNVTYTDSEIKRSQVNLRRRPQWSGGAAINMQWQQFNANIRSDYRSEFFDSSIATGELTLPSYLQWHVSGGWQLSQQLRLSLSIDNLFDKQFEQSVGFMNHGRQVAFAIDYKI
ncbi:hypothetical protein CW748_09325 [Alteromonadales bacterium alter-6D02]|nr:hypothetical protein CW748_09325 [Alteromonadales bacterium alter-6D02]